MGNIENIDSKYLKPIGILNKTNEIIDALNDGLNTNYTAKNPILTSVNGICTWTITHNLGTENISYTLYEGSDAITAGVSIVSENVITVTFNSESNIAANTFQIVIIAKGSVGSNGDSLLLNTISDNDGTLIMNSTSLDNSLSSTSTNGVQNKVITNALNSKLNIADYTIDSALNDTSANPVQNSVIYPSLSGFLPKGTVINVKADGTGDFTNLKDAISSLNGKWSNGTVTIQIATGTYQATATINLRGYNCNIPQLNIQGATSTPSDTTLMCTTTPINVQHYYNGLKIANIAFTASNKLTGSSCIYNEQTSPMELNNITINNFGTGLYLGWYSNTIITGNISFSNCTTAINAENYAKLLVEPVAVNMTNISTCYNIIRNSSATLVASTNTFSNITTKSNITKNTWSAAGVLFVEGDF